MDIRAPEHPSLAQDLLPVLILLECHQHWPGEESESETMKICATVKSLKYLQPETSGPLNILDAEQMLMSLFSDMLPFSREWT